MCLRERENYRGGGRGKWGGIDSEYLVNQVRLQTRRTLKECQRNIEEKGA